MTANSILEMINATMTAEDYHLIVKKIKEQNVPGTRIVTPQKDPKA